MRTYIINGNDCGQRLDKFLTKTMRTLPVSLMYKYIRKKRIKVNGKKSEIGYILTEGDAVDLYIPDEFFAENKNGEAIIAKPKINVIFEDDNILIVSKKPGQLVHDGDGTDNENTLLLNIRSYLVQNGEYIPERENSFSPALCNRIDRNTGGMVIAAKNAVALREMNEAIKNRNIDKKYLCAVHGSFAEKEAVVSGYLTKNTKTKTVFVTDNPQKNSKKIITGYKVIDRNDEYDLTLLEVSLLTGRTHQIRAHMEFLGHSLLGEGKYGKNREDRKISYKHQALYSYKLTFNITSGELSYLNRKTFCADSSEIRFLELFKRSKYGKLFYSKEV